VQISDHNIEWLRGHLGQRFATVRDELHFPFAPELAEQSAQSVEHTMLVIDKKNTFHAR
jgi:hypothetical protein